MIQFSNLPPTGWLIAAAILAAAILSLSYRWAKGRANPWLRQGLAALRWFVVGAVVLCLLNPEWVEAIKRPQQSRLAVMLDTSRSMATRDVGPGRLAAARDWIRSRLGDSPPEGTVVEYYTFNRSLTPSASLDAAEATGDATGLADALEGLLAQPREDPLVGVLLCSDGIETQGKDPEAAARSFRHKGIPIHALAVGTTNDMRDIVIENVQVKRAVPHEAPTRIAVLLRSSGYRDQSVPVQVLRGNQLVASQSLRLKDGPQRIELELIPRERGFQTYEVRVPVQAGEWLATNNRRRFGVEVVDPSIRVLYMEGTPQQSGSPIPEWKYLKDALESDRNIKVKTLYRRFGSNGQFLNTVDADPETGEKIYPVEHPTQGFPRTMDELLNYDVVIHSDIKKESFSPEQLQNMARLVEEFGGGFVMIGGNSAFGKGGYHRTILDRIIPVAMRGQEDSQARPFRLGVPPAALAHPIIALGTTRQETELIWGRKFPTLYGCNRVERAKPGAIVLGEDPASPGQYGPRLILAVQSIGKGRSMAFTSDTTRTWGKDFETLWGEPLNPALPLSESNCDARYYRQFWVNAVRWLASGRLGRTNNPVTLELARAYCLPNERVAATVQVRSADGTPIDAADVAIVLTAAGKTNAPVSARYDRSSQSYRAELVPPAAADFTAVAVARTKGQMLGQDRQLLTCEAGDRETADLRARPDLMASLARTSGGRSLALSDRVALGSVLSPPPPPSVEYHRTPLWDRSWGLGLILFLLSAEWAVRRLNGMA